MCIHAELVQSCLTLCSDCKPKKRKFVTGSIFSPSICPEVMGPDAMILAFWTLSFKPAFSLSFYTSSRGSLVPLHFRSLEWYHLHIWGSWYFSWQSWFQVVIHPAFLMMYSPCKLNKQGDNTYLWCTPFPIFEPVHFSMSSSNSCFLTCIQFLRRQVRWSGIPISLRIFHSLLWPTQKF